MGTVDRIVRVTVAVIIGVLYLTGTVNGTLAIILLVLAGVLALTSIVGFCPLYALFGMNTCLAKERMTMHKEAGRM